jgi:ParB family transcriptional regulator, chromosome partitioning protein
MSKFLKPRLGRGLSSLISVSELPVERELPSPLAAETSVPDLAEQRLAAPDRVDSDNAESAISIPKQGILELWIDEIVVNPHQPRRRMNEASLAELAASLKGTGLIQPIVVRQAGDRYELIAGERRWRAAQLAGFKTIPVIIKDVDAFAQAQMALVENIQRENLNPMDRAAAYRALISQLGLTQAELAQRLGEDRSSIANYLRLLDLSDAVQMSVIDGRLSLGHAKLLASVPDILEQNRLAQLVVTQELSVRNLERLIQEQKQAAQPVPTRATTSAHLLDLERTLSRQLGLRVQIRSAGRSKTKGRLVCHFANLDQFDDLMGRLGLSAE